MTGIILYIHIDITQVAVLIVYDMWLFLPVEHRHRAGVILFHTHSIVGRVHGDRRQMSQQVQDEGCADHLVGTVLRFYDTAREKGKLIN